MEIKTKETETQTVKVTTTTKEEYKKIESLKRAVDSLNKDGGLNNVHIKKLEFLKKLAEKSENETKEQSLLKEQLRVHIRKLKIIEMENKKRQELESEQTIETEQNLEKTVAEVDLALHEEINTNEGVDPDKQTDTLVDYDDKDKMKELGDMTLPKSHDNERIKELRKELAELLNQVEARKLEIHIEKVKTKDTKLDSSLPPEVQELFKAEQEKTKSALERAELAENELAEIKDAKNTTEKVTEVENNGGKDTVNVAKLGFWQNTMKKMSTFVKEVKENSFKNNAINAFGVIKKVGKDLLTTRDGLYTVGKGLAMAAITVAALPVLVTSATVAIPSITAIAVSKFALSSTTTATFELVKQSALKSELSKENIALYNAGNREGDREKIIDKLRGEIKSKFDSEVKYIKEKRGWPEAKTEKALKELNENFGKANIELTERIKTIDSFSSIDEFNDYNKKEKSKITNIKKVVKQAFISGVAAGTIGAVLEHFRGPSTDTIGGSNMTPAEIVVATSNLGIEDQLSLLQENIVHSKTAEMKMAFMLQQEDIVEKAIENGDTSPELAEKLTEIKTEINAANEIELKDIEKELGQANGLSKRFEIDQERLEKMKEAFANMQDHSTETEGLENIDKSVSHTNVKMKTPDELYKEWKSGKSTDEIIKDFKSSITTDDGVSKRFEIDSEGLTTDPKTGLENAIKELESSLSKRAVGQIENLTSISHTNDLLEKQADLLEKKIEFLKETNPNYPQIAELEDKLVGVNDSLNSGLLNENSIKIAELDTKFDILEKARLDANPDDITHSEKEVELLREKKVLTEEKIKLLKGTVNSFDVISDLEIEASELEDVIEDFDNSQIEHIKENLHKVIPTEGTGIQERINIHYKNIDISLENIKDLSGLEDFDSPKIIQEIERIESGIDTHGELAGDFSKLDKLIDSEIIKVEQQITDISQNSPLNDFQQEQLDKLVSKHEDLQLMSQNLDVAVEEQHLGVHQATTRDIMINSFEQTTGVENANNIDQAVTSLSSTNDGIVTGVANEHTEGWGISTPERNALIQKVIDTGGSDFEGVIKVNDGWITSDRMDIDYDKLSELSDKYQSKLDSVSDLLGRDNIDNMQKWQMKMVEEYNKHLPTGEQAMKYSNVADPIEFSKKMVENNGIPSALREQATNLVEYGDNMKKMTLLDSVSKINPEDLGFGNHDLKGSNIPKTQVELNNPTNEGTPNNEQTPSNDEEQTPFQRASDVTHAHGRFGR